MHILQYVKLSIKKICKFKNNKYLILIEFLLTMLLIILLTFSSNLNNYIDLSIYKNIGFRTIGLAINKELNDKEINQLKEISGIVDIYSSKYDNISLESNLKINGNDGFIELIHYNFNKLNNDENYIICPDIFIPDSSIYDVKIDKNKIVNAKNLINSEIEIKYYSYKRFNNKIIKDKEYVKKFTLIDTYKNTDYLFFNNQCIISNKNMKEIIDITELEENKNYIASYYIVVDEIKNLSTVISEIKKFDFVTSYDIKNTIDINTTDNLITISKIVISIIFFSIILVSTFYLKKKINNEEKTIGILKTIGYKYNFIRIIYLLEFILMYFIIYVIGLIITLILIYILKETILFSLVIFGFNIKIYINDIIISLIIAVIVPLIINQYLLNKSLNKFSKNLVEEE